MLCFEKLHQTKKVMECFRRRIFWGYKSLWCELIWIISQSLFVWLCFVECCFWLRYMTLDTKMCVRSLWSSFCSKVVLLLMVVQLESPKFHLLLNPISHNKFTRFIRHQYRTVSGLVFFVGLQQSLVRDSRIPSSKSSRRYFSCLMQNNWTTCG